MQNSIYPKGPANVPPDFTAPGKAYKKHIWIASLALVLFMVLYIGLTGWFLYKAYRLFENTFAAGRDSGPSFLSGLLMLFLGFFMIKALFYLSKKTESADIEIKQEDEPLLFEFIYKVADDLKAPRPHKVFLSDTVNASVFYHVSIINLFFPTRKNLVIGLGLVNTLDLGEFKAILAHEFGHFTQRSMIIGRWVYIVYRVAYQIVARRDWLDEGLRTLSSIDFRVAWIGWIFSIIIWSLRSISDTFFRLVLITQRALSREMEFHADLVAVSLTGSDALIHSLHKLHAADNAYEEAIEFANSELKKKHTLPDIYAIQANHIRHMAVVLNNPEYGASPKPDNGDGSRFRVFKDQMAQPPKMWNTHPYNMEREKNAKAVYIRSEPDERSPWILFRNPEETRNKMTRVLYRDVKTETTTLSLAESLELQDKLFQRSFLLPKYRGVYLSRYVFLSFKTVDEIYDNPLDVSAITSILPTLYPESLQDKLEHLRNLEEEIELLEGLNKKVLDANEGKINFRNREISRKELPAAIAQSRKEAEAAGSEITSHDKLCRNVFYAAAKHIGNGWDTYLQSVTRIILYCEHSQKNIEDLSRYFYETLAVVAKIRNVSFAELSPLINAANQLHVALSDVFIGGKDVRLSAPMTARLDGKQFEELLEPFGLGTADQSNINMWIEVLPGWLNVALNALRTLKEAAFEELLLSESYVQGVFPSGNAEPAPPSNRAAGYLKYDPAVKREVTIKPDLFSRIYNADNIYTTIGRLAVASLIIFIPVFLTASLGQNNLFIYNGMPVGVIVHVADKTVEVEPNQFTDVLIDKSGKIQIKTTTTKGESIETFPVYLPSSSRTFVYNVAGAAVLYKSLIYYGTPGYLAAHEPVFKMLGPKRWEETRAEYLFQEPPASMTLSEKTDGVSVLVLSVYPGHPLQQANVIENKKDRDNFVAIHCLWEKTDAPYLSSWLSMGMEVPDFADILKKRLAANPFEVASLRMQQEFYKGAEKEKLCEQHSRLYQGNPGNPDLYYIYVRCWDDGPKQDSAFLAGYEKWPANPWLAYASAYIFAQHEEWGKALECYKVVYANSHNLRAQSVDDMKRVAHLLNQDSVMSRIDPRELPYLTYVTAVENSQPANANAAHGDNVFYAFKLLSEGKLQEALDYSITDSSVYKSILIHAAVSDGATGEIITQALQRASPETAYEETMISEIAFLLKNGRPVTGYRDVLGNYADSVFKFINYIETNETDDADRMISKSSVEAMGKLSLLGVLMLGEKAPERWNLYASTLLFINEKPYRENELKSWDIRKLK